MGLIDFVAVTAGVVIGTGFLVGIAGAGAALATVGEVVAAVAVLVALASVFEASQERSASHKLCIIKRPVILIITVRNSGAVSLICSKSESIYGSYLARWKLLHTGLAISVSARSPTSVSVNFD